MPSFSALYSIAHILSAAVFGKLSQRRRISLLTLTHQYMSAASYVMDHKFRKDYVQVQNFDTDLDVSHEIIIALKQLNMEKLEVIVDKVSDPTSEIYGQHLSREEVGELTFNSVALDVVIKYLQVNDILDYQQTLYGEYIKANAPRGKWEEIFNAKFMAYKHVSSGKIVFRSSSYTLHSSLIDHVTSVSNIVDLPYSEMSNLRDLPIQSDNKFSSQGSGSIVPSVLNSYYNIFSNKGNSLTSQTVYSTINQYFSSTDLATFQSTFGIPAHPVDKDVNHRNNPGQCSYHPSSCYESNLDLQYILAVAQNVPTSIT